jgi:hypothetical protein
MSHYEDIRQAQQLVLWARGHRVQLGRLRVGHVELELQDLELDDRPAPEKEGEKKVWSPPVVPEPKDMYAELARQMGMNGVTADDLDRGMRTEDDR